MQAVMIAWIWYMARHMHIEEEPVDENASHSKFGMLLAWKISMKNVFGLSVVCLGLLFGSQQANAQHPGYGQHGMVHQGYVQSGYGHHQNFHHGHQFAVPSPNQYYSGYGSPVQSYAPSGGLYGGGNGYGQIVIPRTTTSYSNNYYGQPTHSHHSWHPGHYLLGHH